MVDVYVYMEPILKSKCGGVKTGTMRVRKSVLVKITAADMAFIACLSQCICLLYERPP